MITIGADPELFIYHTDDETQAVPVCGLIGGTKNAPLPIPDLPNGYSVQEDNVMLEFNIPPAGSPRQFINGIQAAMSAIRETVIPKGYRVMNYTNYAVFNADTLPPQALEFGCSPEFDACDNGSVVPKLHPDELMSEDGALRFAGGHMHFGYGSTIKYPPFVIASFLDIALGLFAIQFGERQGKRRQFYGQPGRFRPTSYGIEYRTLSNNWLWHKGQAHHLAGSAHSMLTRLQSTPESTVRRWFAEIPWLDVWQVIREEDEEKAIMLRDYIEGEVMRK